MVQNALKSRAVIVSDTKADYNHTRKNRFLYQLCICALHLATGFTYLGNHASSLSVIRTIFVSSLFISPKISLGLGMNLFIFLPNIIFEVVLVIWVVLRVRLFTFYFTLFLCSFVIVFYFTPLLSRVEKPPMKYNNVY